MILPDYPIEKEEQDQLRRLPLAKKVAEMVAEFEGKESFVIGVEGKWGSGKTSFINLVLGALNKEKSSYFVFNPWIFSDEASLLSDFFIKYSGIVEEITGKKIGRKIRDYVGKLSNIDLPIPKWEYIKFILSSFCSDTSLGKLREELNTSLKGISKKIIVVIDDIDRLDKRETKLIFKLVKLTADFPNTIFILAYDRKRVEKNITDENDGIEGGEYLKKIIQVSFTLPLPDQQELWSILFKDLDLTLQDVYKTNDVLKEGDEKNRWDGLFFGGFGNLFDTIRDIKRYISSLRLTWRIMGRSDVNKIDFLGIEAVRVFAPIFYNVIPTNKELFIESPDFFDRVTYGSGNGEEPRRRQYQELLENLIADEKTRKRIDGVCKELFPQLNSGATHPSDKWERELRICHPERFKFYFQLGIPHGEISESQISEVVAALDDREAFKEFILQFKEEKRLRKVLTKLLQRRDMLDEAKIKNALSIFWELEKQIDDTKEAVFDLDNIDMQVLRFAYQTLKQIQTSNRNTLLAGLIQGCPNIYYPVHLVAILRQGTEKEIQSGETAILAGGDIKGLEQILVNKIKAAAMAGSLKNEKHLVLILYRWKEWESATAVMDYIRSLISTREGLLIFLKAFVSKVLSSAGNYNDMNPDSISGLYPIDEVNILVSAITEDEISFMSNEEKEAISLLKDRPNRW